MASSKISIQIKKDIFSTETTKRNIAKEIYLTVAVLSGHLSRFCHTKSFTVFVVGGRSLNTEVRIFFSEPAELFCRTATDKKPFLFFFNTFSTLLLTALDMVYVVGSETYNILMACKQKL